MRIYWPKDCTVHISLTKYIALMVNTQRRMAPSPEFWKQSSFINNVVTLQQNSLSSVLSWNINKNDISGGLKIIAINTKITRISNLTLISCRLRNGLSFIITVLSGFCSKHFDSMYWNIGFILKPHVFLSGSTYYGHGRTHNHGLQGLYPRDATWVR